MRRRSDYERQLPPKLGAVYAARLALKAGEAAFHRTIRQAAEKHPLREVAEAAGLSISRVHQIKEEKP